ncbi:MAG: hypothetical protein KBC69_03230 [Candidatus Magasanikbacteria bacterium]|nr:hypothetical protein [Candidatus Magasanikbacteria bacterium]
MKILVTHSSDFDFRNKLYKPLRDSTINSKYEFRLPQETEKEKLTKDIVKECVAVIAECSLPSTGQGIELGWADAFNIPIICIHEKGSKISNALHYVSNTFIEYNNEVEMIEKLQEHLNKLT